jgi:hypothetical protein
MANKLDRKAIPSGYNADSFKYMGRPAKDQGDFGTDVGLADAACVNQFGEANNAKYYHAGVVPAKDNTWWCYLEWGRIKSGKSWSGNSFSGQDFQFIQCSGEADARAFFASQMASKNTSRMEQKDIGGTKVWVSATDKSGKSKDGYIVQSLATRERGLPDAYGIKDDTGITAKTPKKDASPATKKTASASMQSFHPQEIALAQALVGGTVTYARAASAATGIVPTMDAITQVRDSLLPLALQRIKVVGDSVEQQVKDRDLIDISKMVAAIVPTVVPRSATQEARERMTILSADNIFQRQQDLDAFEAALRNEDFEVTTAPQTTLDPDKLLGATLRWIDPRSEHGLWLTKTYLGMTNNRHGNLRGAPRILNMFSVSRPDRDCKFVSSVAKVAALRQGKVNLKARLQPPTRPDVADLGANYNLANCFLGIHGTRSVNVAPILQTNLRLPKSLAGVHISGSAFGHGVYAATDIKKSLNYCSASQACWSGNVGGITGRGFFMFLQDVLMGVSFPAKTTGTWQTPPNNCDSIAAYPDFMPSLQNDEHIIFNPDYQRIRYLIEGEMR